jgi:PHD/YefM family antitoxin component YafN of YafNO toxin-antitoxin module
VPLAIMLRAKQNVCVDSAEEKEHVKTDRARGGPL